jgi:hypothetical protein
VGKDLNESWESQNICQTRNTGQGAQEEKWGKYIIFASPLTMTLPALKST